MSDDEASHRLAPVIAHVLPPELRRDLADIDDLDVEGLIGDDADEPV